MPSTYACQRCGAQLFAEDRFCGSCGTPRTPPPVPGGTPSTPTTSGETTAYGSRLLAMVRKATIGEYEIRGEIGRGGMAAVYLAYDLRLNRKVAVKVMLPELALHEGMEDRFRREARTAAKLDHQNIVVIYSVRDEGELLYFVMKYIDGASLEQLLRKYAPFPIPAVQHILLQLASALQYAHDEGVVHRDVKPANVLVDRRGNSLVTDFGIAKATESPTLTRTGSVIGTPAYMSPEQCMGNEQTHASDQYSLGVLAYEMIAGRPPFAGPSVELQWAHVKTEPPSLQEARPDCPPALAAAVMRMLVKDPSARWPSLQDAMPTLAGGLVPGDDSPRAKLAEFVRVVAPSRTDAMAVTPASPIPRGRTAPPTWTSIRLAPAEASLEQGNTLELAVAFLPTPAPNVETPRPTWSSSASDIVAVSPSGVVTALAVGSATITAQVGELSASCAIAVQPVPVASVHLSPLSQGMEIGTKHRIPCVVRDARNRELTGREVLWASSNPGVASVNADGEVTAVALGSATIGATSESVTATTRIEVVPDRVAGVTVSPETLTLQERDSARLSITATNERGKAIPHRQVMVRSADPSIATVGAGGVVTAKALGRTTITATIEGQTTAIDVVVRPADVATLAITPQAPSLIGGDSLTFAAEAHDATGVRLADRIVKWRSSDPAVLKIDDAGHAVGGKGGSVTVTAECERVSATVRVAVAPAPIVSAEIVGAPTTLRAGKKTRLRAKAVDRTGAEQEPERVTWRTSNPNIATVAADGTISAIAAGPVTITATIAGYDVRRDLTIAAAPPPRPIPLLAGIGGGAVVAIVAAVMLFKGGSDETPVPGEKTSTDSTPAVTPPLPPTPPPRTDTAIATRPEPAPPPVEPPPASVATVTGLRVTSRRALALERGEDSRATVQATMSDGSSSAARGVTWSAANPSIASVSPNGTITARAEGQTSVTATLGTATARVDVTVIAPVPARVAISPRPNPIKAGESTNLTARVWDRSDAAMTYQVVWRSGNPTVAAVDSYGSVRGVRGGDAYIFAVAGGATDSVRVTVESVQAAVIPTPPRPADPGPSTSVANAPSAAEMETALKSAARVIADAISNGRFAQLTATSQFSKVVRDDHPELAGDLQVARSSALAADRVEGDVVLPLRWTNFVGRQQTAAIVLRITLERRNGSWRTTAARNLNNP